jgi:hypothetical protein
MYQPPGLKALIIRRSFPSTSNAKKRYTFLLSPIIMSFTLSAIAILLLGAHFFVYFFTRYVYPSKDHMSMFLSRQFNLNEEANVPTFFSSLILLMAAGLLFFIYATVQKSAKNKSYWLILSLIFIFLCLDEATQIHDELNLTFQSRYSTLPGFLSLGWVIPYFFMVLVVGISFTRFLFSLPSRTRNLFFLSGIIYVFGALILELFEGKEYKHNGFSTSLFVFQTVQEVLEMGGVILFIYALLDYMGSFKTSVIIDVKEPELYY